MNLTTAMAELKKILSYDRNSKEFLHQHVIHKSSLYLFSFFLYNYFFTQIFLHKFYSKLYFMLDIN